MLAVSVALAITAVVAIPAVEERALAANGLHRPVAAVAPTASARPRPVRPGTVTVLHLRSPDGAPHDVWVYRPAVADSASLPVLYFLHGTPGAPSDVFNIGLAQSMDATIAAGGPPMVIAAPDGNGASHADTEWADAVDGTDQLETFVTTTVVAAVEGDHRRSRENRAIAGFSMGGFGAVNLADHHPELFGQVASIAGYFHIDDPDHVFGDSPDALADNTPINHLDTLRQFRLLVMDADRDAEPAVAGEADRLASRLTAKGIRFELRVAPGTHSWRYVQTQLPTLFSFLGGGFGPPAPPD